MEIAQAAKVAVANCPTTATETSRSVEISTWSAVTTITPVMMAKTITQSAK